MAKAAKASKKKPMTAKAMKKTKGGLAAKAIISKQPFAKTLEK